MTRQKTTGKTERAGAGKCTGEHEAYIGLESTQKTACWPSEPLFSFLL